MKRTILAIGAVLLAAPMLFVSAAEACISCEYVPEVLNARPAAKPYVGKTYESKGAGNAYIRALSPKKRIPGSLRSARKPAPEKVTTARKQPEADSKSTESKSTESKSAEAPVRAEANPAEEPKVANKAGCVKYFPNVGLNVAVPCE